MSTTPATYLSPVSLTSAFNPCRGFSVIASVVDTSDKFITGVQLSPVTSTPAINLSPVNKKNIAGDNNTDDNFIAVDKTRTPWREYSLSPVEKFISGVVDTGEQFIVGVVDTGEQFIASDCPGDVDTGQK